MSYWTIFVLFIKAFLKSFRSTFYGDLLKYLDTTHPEVEKGIFVNEYFIGVSRVLTFLRVDVILKEIELRQIRHHLHITSAAKSYAWLMEFEKYVDKYIDSPMSRDSDAVYIPLGLTAYFTKTEEVSALDYLLENGDVCAIVPYLEDMREGFQRLYSKINRIEDDIMREYYIGKLRPLIMDTEAFIRNTIEWTLVYDRP